MGILRLLPAAALLAQAACYEPRLADCVVPCSSSDECAPGQACGAHGYCAAPELACAAAGGPDGGPGGPDGPRQVQLRVKVSGHGRVIVDGAGQCGAEPKDGCMFSVTASAPRTLRAIADDDHMFDQWASFACGSAGALCVLVPAQPLTEVHARFEREP